MKKIKDTEIRPRHFITLVLIIVALFLWLLMATGCKTIKQEVPVIVERSHETRSIDIVRDTLLLRDSVFHYIQGDTVKIERWHYTTRVEVVQKSDTVRDTIPKVVTVTKTVVEKDNRPPWWMMFVFIVLLFVIVGLRLRN